MSLGDEMRKGASADREEAVALFRTALERDGLRATQPALTDWAILGNTKTEEDRDLLVHYHGARDLLHWITGYFLNLGSEAGVPEDWYLRASWDRPRAADIDLLIAESARLHELLLRDVGEFDQQRYRHTLRDVENVQDYHYCVSLVPNLSTVLDYGGGYGRQAFLFPSLPGLRLFMVDAVEQPYLLQRYVIRKLGLRLWEYLESLDVTKEQVISMTQSENGPQVAHLPTWRNDLLPDAYFDVVMFVWCLYEMSQEAMELAIETCSRVVKPGGFVYLHDVPHTRAYRTDPEAMLEERGFKLTYYPWKLHEREIHGIPRLYRRSQSAANFTAGADAKRDMWSRYTPSLRRQLARVLRGAARRVERDA